MKLATHATEPFALLIGVLEKSGVQFKRKLLDVSAGALGIDLYSKDFPEIAQIVETSGDIAGWFGYESNPPRLSVWFYCNESIGTRSGVRDRIKSVLEKASFTARAFQEDESNTNIGVFCPPDDSPGDQEWFTQVLNAFKA